METKILFTEISNEVSEKDIESLREIVENKGFLVLFLNSNFDMDIIRKVSNGLESDILSHIYIFKEDNKGCTIDRYGMADCLNFGITTLLKSDLQKAKERALIVESMVTRFTEQGYGNSDIYAFSSNLMRDLPTIDTVANRDGEIGITNIISPIEPLLEECLKSMKIEEETNDFCDMLFDNYPLIEESQYKSLSEFIRTKVLKPTKKLEKAS